MCTSPILPPVNDCESGQEDLTSGKANQILPDPKPKYVPLSKYRRWLLNSQTTCQTTKTDDKTSDCLFVKPVNDYLSLCSPLLLLSAMH